MKAALALLGDREIQNFVRKLSWEIHQKYRTGTTHCRLPPHISLKQPFRVTDLTALEAYMSELASSIQPFEIHFTELRVVPIVYNDREDGILWIDVQETDYLRQLHERVNAELSKRFGSTQADYDGSAYHFHMTVMIGGQPIEMYRRFLAEIADPRVNLHFTARELAMFVYDEPMGPQGEYLAYRTLPVGDW